MVDTDYIVIIWFRWLVDGHPCLMMVHHGSYSLISFQFGFSFRSLSADFTYDQHDYTININKITHPFMNIDKR